MLYSLVEKAPHCSDGALESDCCAPGARGVARSGHVLKSVECCQDPWVQMRALHAAEAGFMERSNTCLLASSSYDVKTASCCKGDNALQPGANSHAARRYYQAKC